MSLLWIVVVGLFTGAVTKFTIPGKHPSEWLITMLWGVVGALLAGCMGRLAGMYAETGPTGFIGSLVGAAMIMPISYQVDGRRRR